MKTASITATVSLKTGEVSFSDKDGKPVITENTGGGKTFQPMEVDGKKAYTIRQVFESPDDEAFYGLGQRQTVHL